MLKNKSDFEYLNLDFEQVQMSDTVYHPLILCVQVKHY